MFGTLRAVSSGEEPYMVEATSPPFKDSKDSQPSRPACIPCRLKKLKCTSEQTGCQRCINKNLHCQYIIHRLRDRRVGAQRNAERTKISLLQQAEDSQSSTAQPILKSQQLGIEDSCAPSGRLPQKPDSSQSSSKFPSTGMNTPDKSGGSSLDQSQIHHSPFTNDSDLLNLDDAGSLIQFLEDGMGMQEENWVFNKKGDFWPAPQLTNIFDSDPPERQPTFPSESQASPHTRPPAPNIDEPNIRPPNNDLAQERIQKAPTTTGVSSVSSFNSSTCQCILAILRIFEKLLISTNANVDHPSFASEITWSINELLHFLKEAVASCMSMMHCTSCSTESTMVALAASVCDKMILQFEQVIRAYSPGSFSPSRVSSGDCLDSGRRWPSGMNLKFSKDAPDSNSSRRDIGMSELKIDGDDEIRVVKVLLISRMKYLDQLLGRMLKIVSGNGSAWKGHREVLERIGGRLHAMAVGLNTMDYGADLGRSEGMSSVNGMRSRLDIQRLG